MMTDIQKLLALLDEFGILPTINKYGVAHVLTVMQGDLMKDGRTIKGYNYFETQFIFHEDGSFDNMGAWEE